MENKTCGKCKYFVTSDHLDVCVVECDTRRADSVCNHRDEFEPKVITNGDVIRQGGNRDFAEYFVYETGAVFASTLIVDKTFDTYEEAVKATEDYLNAPAEIEGKEVDNEN